MNNEKRTELADEIGSAVHNRYGDKAALRRNHEDGGFEIVHRDLDDPIVLSDKIFEAYESISGFIERKSESDAEAAKNVRSFKKDAGVKIIMDMVTKSIDSLRTFDNSQSQN